MELLFENSVEALKNKEIKKISVYFSEIENNFIIKFCDTGVGIKSKDARKIFQYSFSTKKSGSGIGLGQVTDNLKALSGEIKYNGSENEYNTVFLLTIPNNK